MDSSEITTTRADVFTVWEKPIVAETLRIGESGESYSSLTGVSWLSHAPLVSDYDEPSTLSQQIILYGPISADVGQAALKDV